MQDEHRPRPLADDEVAFPMTGFLARLDGVGPIMNRSAILDQFARGPSVTRPSAFVPMQQISPQGLGLLGGPIDEGVDRLATDNPQRQFVLRLEPTGDLLGRPTLGEAVSDEAAEAAVRFDDRFTPPARYVGSGGVKRRIPAGGERVAPQFPGNRGLGPPQDAGDAANRPSGRAQNSDLISFVLRQVRIGLHGNTP